MKFMTAAAFVAALAGGSISAQNLVTNQLFTDTNTDSSFGDSWTALGNTGFAEFTGGLGSGADADPGGGLVADSLTIDGAGVLDGSTAGNLGLISQGGISVTPGTTFEFSVQLNAGTNFDADVTIGLEFFDSSTSSLQIDELALDPAKVAAGDRVRIRATAPGDAATVTVSVAFANAAGAASEAGLSITEAVLVAIDDPTNLLSNPRFDDQLDLSTLGAAAGVFFQYGTNWNDDPSFSSGPLNFFNFEPGVGTSGHQSFFGDNLNNAGEVFQKGIPAEEGVEYQFQIAANFETNYQFEDSFGDFADTFFGLEFYAADDQTLVGSRTVEITGEGSIGGAYFNSVGVAGVAPAGTAFVRPVIAFDVDPFAPVGLGGEGATFDEAELRANSATTNRLVNPSLANLNDAVGFFADFWNISGGTYNFGEDPVNFNPFQTPNHAFIDAADGDTLEAAVFQQGIAAVPNETYTFYAHIATEGAVVQGTDTGEVELFLALEFYDGSDGQIGNDASPPTIVAPLSVVRVPVVSENLAGYERFEVTATAPAGTVFVRPLAGLTGRPVPDRDGPNPENGEAVTIDDLVLQKFSPDIGFNAGLEDLFEDGSFGDGWGTFGAVAFDNFFPNGNPGHGVLFADIADNEGGAFLISVPATPGATYLTRVDFQAEDNYDAVTTFGFEFRDLESQETPLQVDTVEVVENPGAGYETLVFTAVAPAGAQLVRPVLTFSNSSGTAAELEAATFDNFTVFVLGDFDLDGDRDVDDVNGFISGLSDGTSLDLVPEIGTLDAFDLSVFLTGL
ncbi:MAG: hypothetical protein AAGI30_00030 [Planctomycetota bacterium]